MRRAIGLLLAASLLAGCAPRAPKAEGPKVIPVSNTPSAAPAAIKACEEGLGANVDAAHAEGMSIVEVCITGASPVTVAVVRNALALRPGKLLTAALLRRDLEAAYATKLLEQIEATARASGSGAVLFLALTERAKISSLTVEGVVGLTGDDRTSTLALLPKVGDPTSEKALVAAQRKIEAVYAELGWTEATVGSLTEPDGKGGVRVKIVVVERARAKVGKVTFEGARGGRDTALRKAVELTEGAPLTNQDLDRAALLAAQHYYDHGFLNVKIDVPKRTRAGDGTTAIAFPITEGPQLRIGKVRFTGVDAAREKEIRAGLGVKTGEIFGRSRVINEIAAIKNAARQKGRPVEVEPQTEIDLKVGIVDLTLVITDAH